MGHSAYVPSEIRNSDFPALDEKSSHGGKRGQTPKLVSLSHNTIFCPSLVCYVFFAHPKIGICPL